MNKKILIPLVALAITTGAGFLYIKTAQAADTNRTSIVQELATKFGLKEADVESVFTAHRNEMQKNHQQSFTDRLNQAVADGKLTEAQKNAVVAKHEELKKLREAEQQQRQQKRDELAKWAEDNKIDPSFLFGQMRDGAPHMQRMNGAMR